MCRELKQFWEERKQNWHVVDTEGLSPKFVDVMEVIYGIILAVALSKVVLGLQITWSYVLGVVICIGALVRFFFAPTKNIICLGQADMKWKWAIMFIDVPILLTHSIFYYHMCANITPAVVGFYLAFVYLLLINVLWLGSIWLRFSMMKKQCPNYLKVWTINNVIFVLVIGFLVLLGNIHWGWLFAAAFLNCFLDLLMTYPDYLRTQCET